MNRNPFCYGISIFALICTFVGHSLCLAAANYEIWAGDEDLLDIPLAYYNVDEYGYVKLGRASGVATFHGDYQYYVVAVTNQLYLDAVQGSDGYFYGEEGGAYLVTGNVFDWDNAVGPTNDQYAVLGGEGSENFTSYFRITNPGTWTSITVYALSESPLHSHFKVDPNFNSLWGHDDWPAGETVTITVGDPVEFEGHASVNEWGDWNLWEIPHDIQAGALVRVEYGEIVREHVVREVQVVSVDPDANTVSGTAATGTWVNVSIYGPPFSRNVQADSDGLWQADFSVEGEEEWEGIYNIEVGAEGCACQFDEEGNSTHINWRLPDPVLRVNPSGNWIWGEGWPAGAAVELTIGDPGSPAVTAVVHAAGDGHWGFDPDEGVYYIQAGHVITADDGTHVRSMTVADLSVTGADSSANTLSGTGPPEAYVLVRVGEITVEALSDNHGEWTTDLGAEGIDVQEGTSGYLYFYDEHGHFTKTFWRYASLDVDEIALIWLPWDDHNFFLMEIEGQGILGARFQAPSGEWYDLHPDDWELEWWLYEKRADDLASLDAEFEPGEYRVEISHYHGVSTAIVTFAEMPEMPNATPEITAPTFGQSDVATPETELEWASVADPNFNVILIYYWDEFSDQDEENEEVIFLDPGELFPTSMTMTNLQPDRVYVSELIFINMEFGDTTGDVETEFLIVRANPIAETVFSTNTDPNRFDSIDRVDFAHFVIEENREEAKHIFSFEAYFTNNIDSLYYEVSLWSPGGKEYMVHGPGAASVHDNEILFEIKAEYPDDLPGDGWYALVLRPDHETAVCTPFWFGTADQANPLPMPQQQPVITQPLQDDLLASPILITWEALTDPDVNTLAVILADDQDPVLLGNLEQTEYGPIEKEAGEHLVGIIFAHGLFEQENDDGIAFDAAKVRGTLCSYTIGHVLTYQAGSGGALQGPIQQIVRDGEDGQEVVAEPEVGALLAQWSDGVETTQRRDTHVTEDITVTAHFMSEGGVPIDWYVAYGIAPEEGDSWVDVDQDDSDGDGMKNWEEYVADTNPTNKLSVLRFRGLQMTETGMRIEWQGGVQARQILERAVDLTHPDPWQPVLTNEPPTPVVNEHVDALPEQEPRFYRITVERP